MGLMLAMGSRVTVKLGTSREVGRGVGGRDGSRLEPQ